MTVEELIEKLKTMPQDKEVNILFCENGYYCQSPVEIVEEWDGTVVVGEEPKI